MREPLLQRSWVLGFSKIVENIVIMIFQKISRLMRKANTVIKRGALRACGAGVIGGHCAGSVPVAHVDCWTDLGLRGSAKDD